MSDQMIANSVQLLPFNTDLLIVRADSPDGAARRWRVGLQRLERIDNHAPIIESAPYHPGLVSDSYGFAAGIEDGPISDSTGPRRSNPVQITFNIGVQINWGLGAARPAHLAASWPRMGASVILIATTVEVYARNVIAVGQPTPAPNEATAVATAWVGQADGQIPEDAGELGFEQVIVVPPHSAGPPTHGGAAVFVPDFARRVRIGIVNQRTDGNYVDPATGELPISGTWYDDTGNSWGSWAQGPFTPPAGVQLYAPVSWHPVPAQATMLMLRVPAGASNALTMVEWRIAP